MEETYEMLYQQFVRRAKKIDDKDSPREGYEAAVADYETKKQELEQLKVEIRAKERGYVDSETFMKSLESIAVPIDSFREELWLSLIDHACVPEKKKRVFIFVFVMAMTSESSFDVFSYMVGAKIRFQNVKLHLLFSCM